MEMSAGEAAFVHNGLKILHYHLVPLLLKHQDVWCEHGDGSIDDVHRFVEAVSDMYQVHSSALVKFEAACAGCNAVLLGAALDGIVTVIASSYCIYVNRQDLVLDQLNEAATVSEELHNDIDNMLHEVCCKGVSLGSILIQPMQRTIAYTLTLERIMKHSVEPDEQMEVHKWLSRVEQAVATMDEVTAEVRRARALVKQVKGLPWAEVVHEGMHINEYQVFGAQPGAPLEVDAWILKDRVITATRIAQAGEADGVADVNGPSMTTAQGELRDMLRCEDVAHATVAPIQSEADLIIGFLVVGVRHDQSITEVQLYHDDQACCERWMEKLRELFGGSLHMIEPIIITLGTNR